jgi:hypothetical protein
LDHGCTILHALISGEHLQAVLLDDGEELDGHALGFFTPLSHFSTVDSLKCQPATASPAERGNSQLD